MVDEIGFTWLKLASGKERNREVLVGKSLNELRDFPASHV
jgi:hypothetical protein